MTCVLGIGSSCAYLSFISGTFSMTRIRPKNMVETSIRKMEPVERPASAMTLPISFQRIALYECSVPISLDTAISERTWRCPIEISVIFVDRLNLLN